MIKKILLGILVFILVLAAGGYFYYRIVIYQPPAISEEDRSSIYLMPLPSSLKIKGGEFEITRDLKISLDNYSDERLEKAVGRFLERLIERSGVEISSNSQNANFIISCLAGSENEIQQLKEIESYTLNVNSKRIELESASPYGILRGLETLLQLLIVEEDKRYIPAVEIVDSPRFPWRGLMIDVCRHWMPKEVILRNLDVMATVKLNVLHMHLSEDQGFRVESKVFPKLHELGSNGKYYTQEDIKEIVSHASDLGIRIVPEFDVPGHSKSWQIAYPELSSVSTSLEFGQGRGELFSPPLDPTNEVVYEFLDKFFGEMALLFPDQYLHIGGDEVNPKFWNENPEVQQFMVENNMENAHDLQAYFNFRMNEIVNKHGKIMLGWEEILHDDLSDDVIIQSWKSHKSLFEGVQRGGTAILSAGYYLDHKLHAEKHYGVDPLVLPGAVDIIPDYDQWKMYDIKIELPGNAMDGQLILFDRDPQNAFGFFAFLDDRNAFKNGKIQDGIITFDFSTPVGELEFSAMIDEDSISGNLSLGILKFASWGNRSGGSDMEGTEMPEIEIMKPLTEDEQRRIIGGEAAMWSEVVSNETIDSRIWPRTAAIAEKLWSPAELTTDVDDMYRRLEAISNLLSDEGSIHIKQYSNMLVRLAGKQAFQPLKDLVDVLEEVKYYNRLSFVMEMEEFYMPDIQLDHVADIARPESLQARKFNKLVDAYLQDYSDESKTIIIDQITAWSHIYDQLSPYIADNPRLQEINLISSTFSKVAKIIVGLEGGMKLNEMEMEGIIQDLDYMEVGDNGVLVAVTPGMRKLVLGSLSSN